MEKNRSGKQKRTAGVSWVRVAVLRSDAFGLLEAFALHALALKLAAAADGLGPFASLAFRRLFKGAAQLHFTKHTFALQLLFQDLHGLIDVIVADCYLHSKITLFPVMKWTETAGFR